MKRSIRTTFILMMCLCLGAITGCSLPQQREATPKNTFLLDVRPDTLETNIGGGSVQVQACRALAPVNDKPLVYRLSNVRYERDYTNLFLVSPAAQIDVALSHLVRSSSQDGGGDLQRGFRWLIRPTLESMWADFDDPNAPQAKVQIHVVITEISLKDRRERVILDQRLATSRPLDLDPKPSAETVVVELSACVRQIVEDLEEKMYELSGSEPPEESTLSL